MICDTCGHIVFSYPCKNPIEWRCSSFAGCGKVIPFNKADIEIYYKGKYEMLSPISEIKLKV